MSQLGPRHVLSERSCSGRSSTEGSNCDATRHDRRRGHLPATGARCCSEPRARRKQIEQGTQIVACSSAAKDEHHGQRRGPNIKTYAHVRRGRERINKRCPPTNIARLRSSVLLFAATRADVANQYAMPMIPAAAAHNHYWPLHFCVFASGMPAFASDLRCAGLHSFPSTQSLRNPSWRACRWR